jgi:transposase-like protein
MRAQVSEGEVLPGNVEPVPIRRPRREYSEAIRARALAMVTAGSSCAEVARELNVAVSTVRYWWREHGPQEPRSMMQREKMGQQVYDTVKATLEALATRARLTADEDWLREQSAAAVAHLDAVHWDRVIRLLSALRPAEPIDVEDDDLETGSPGSA